MSKDAQISAKIKELDPTPSLSALSLKIWRLEAENEVLRNILRQTEDKLKFHVKQHQGYKGAYIKQKGEIK